VRLELLDVGGGLPARYTERIPPVAAYAAAISRAVRELPYPVSLALEPGRTGKNDIAFYLDGRNLDTERTFKSRTITVTPDPG